MVQFIWQIFIRCGGLISAILTKELEQNYLLLLTPNPTTFCLLGMHGKLIEMAKDRHSKHVSNRLVYIWYININEHIVTLAHLLTTTGISSFAYNKQVFNFSAGRYLLEGLT